ncbi:MAG: hypothetical protein HUU20_17405 [Pirellulales bacterium]|nr:hypothetical protein [Pirellulales bacterium]
MALAITAVAGSALLLGVASSLQTTGDCLEQTIAAGMAQQLMDEIAGAGYAEPGPSPYAGSLQPEAGETASGTRESFDDIDDFNGLRQQPPTDRRGVPLGADDGEGSRRHPNFCTPPGYFDRWRQEVDVDYVDPADFTKPMSGTQVSDYRAIEVRIVYVDPDRGSRVLSTLRRVVAYVPAM